MKPVRSLWNKDPWRPISDNEADYVSQFMASKTWAATVKGRNQGKSFNQISTEVGMKYPITQQRLLVETEQALIAAKCNWWKKPESPIEDIIKVVDRTNSELEKSERELRKLHEKLEGLQTMIEMKKAEVQGQRRFLLPFFHVCKRCV